MKTAKARACGFSYFLLTLLALGAVAVPSDIGLVATGSAVLATPAGPHAGTIEVDIWGAQRNRVVIHFLGGESFELISNRGRFSARGGGDLLPMLAAQGLYQGCDLLPQGLLLGQAAAAGVGSLELPPADTSRRIRLFRLPAQRGNPAAAARLAASSGVTFDLDRTGTAVRATFTDGRGQAVVTRYSAYRVFRGVSYPTHVERWVNGVLRLTVNYQAIGPKSFTNADFQTLNPPPGIGPHRFPAAGGRP